MKVRNRRARGNLKPTHLRLPCWRFVVLASLFILVSDPLLLHLVWFIRDTALERLVSSLKYSLFYTRSVSYLSLIFWANPYSLSLISCQPQKLPTPVSQFTIWISEKYNVVFKPINVARGGNGSKLIFCLLPTEFQLVSPNLQRTVISYFYRKD